VTPEELGLERALAEALLGAESAAGNAQILEAIFHGTDGSSHARARRDVVVLNAAACLVVAGVSKDLKHGMTKAAAALQSGAAAALLERLQAFSRDNATVEVAPHPTS
jgi:anthranilate phosphoribosyltransferase